MPRSRQQIADDLEQDLRERFQGEGWFGDYVNSMIADASNGLDSRIESIHFNSARKQAEIETVLRRAIEDLRSE